MCVHLEIEEGIQHCKYVIADLTPDISQQEIKFLHPDYVKLFRRSNPNVMYEIGYAQGLKNEKKIILLMEQKSIDCLPFDLQSKRCITYDMENLQSLEKTLCSWLETSEQKVSEETSVISTDTPIVLSTNNNREKIQQTIHDFRQVCTGDVDNYCEKLMQDLVSSDYTGISIQNYLWLVGWCNTAGAYKNMALIAREIAQAMFGFIPKRYLDSGEDLKVYRYGAHKPITQKIIKHHRQQLQ